MKFLAHEEEETRAECKKKEEAFLAETTRLQAALVAERAALAEAGAEDERLRRLEREGLERYSVLVRACVFLMTLSFGGAQFLGPTFAFVFFVCLFVQKAKKKRKIKKKSHFEYRQVFQRGQARYSAKYLDKNKKKNAERC